MNEPRHSRAAPVAVAAAALVLVATGCVERPAPIPEDRPVVQLSKGRLAISAKADEFPLPIEMVTITNAGTAPLPAPTASVVYAGAAAAWLSAEVRDGEGAYLLRVAPSPLVKLQPGTYRATVVVEAPLAINPTSTIAVELQVLAPAGAGWAAGPPMLRGRVGHTTTPLADGGLLVIGGVAESSIERMDPITGTWSSAGALQRSREGHAAVALLDGRVLVAGGADTLEDDYPSQTWELYDPSLGRVVATGALQVPRYRPGAVLLADGRVLLVGGGDDARATIDETRTAEIFDPQTLATSAVESTAEWYGAARAARLLDGRVLVTGGGSSSFPGERSSCEIFDPATGHWTATGSLGEAREYHGLATLPGGQVLAFGGRVPNRWYDGIARTTTERYDPVSGTWSFEGYLVDLHLDLRGIVPAALLPSGRVLAAGGCAGTWDANECDRSEVVERFDPADIDLSGRASWSWTGANLLQPRQGHTVTATASGRVFVVGGRVQDPTDPHYDYGKYSLSPEHWLEP